MSYSPEVVATGFTFPESPRWHGGRKAFYFVDLDAGNLFELKDRAVRLLHTFPDFISGLSFDDEDGFFVTSAKTSRLLHLTGVFAGQTQVRVVADLNGVAGFGLNDHTRAPNGDIFQGVVNWDAVGYFSDPSIEIVPGKVQRIRPDGSMETMPGDVLLPNGVIVEPGGGRLLMADTFGYKIWAWSMLDDGSLGEPTVWAELDGIAPDGISLDAEGALWIASNQEVTRVREGGEVLAQVNFNKHISACMLGGPDGRTLLVTAAAGFDRQVLYASLTGTLFQVRVDVPGTALPSIYA